MSVRWIAVAGFAIACRAVTVPSGTEIQVRLTTAVSSDNPSGQAVSAVVIVPVFMNGAVAIATGTRLDGAAADAMAYRAATDQTAEQSAKLRLSFTKISDLSGHSKPVDCLVQSVDNARESVDSTGLITGIAASKTFEAEMEKGINKLQSEYQDFAQILSGVKGAFFQDVDASIHYGPGVELTLALTKPLEWSASSASNLPAPILPAEELESLVDIEPFRTLAQNPPSPSDLTNVMFIGTAEQIETAFREGGWFAAESLSRASKFETARAIIENRGYSEAPMSLLYLDGRPPDFTFQKQNDTFAKRHHIRIWRRPELFHGRPVWVAAATHDTSITFSPVSHSFTHGIDPNIDLERAKVVNDLLFTGSVEGLALVNRANIPHNATNATGDRLMTDGKIAVLEFGAINPRSY